MNDDPKRERTVILEDEALLSLQGFTQIPNVILKHQALSFGAKVAFGVLLSYAWQKDFCWPAQESLAADTNCSVRQIRRLLVELKSYNIVTWKQRGLNQPNVYRIRAQKDWIGPNSLNGKERTNLSGPDGTSPDGTNLSGPERPNASHQDETNLSDKVYSKKNIKNVNVNALYKTLEDPEQKDALVFEMLDVLGDRRSTGFYRKLAATVPGEVIFEALAETKYQSNMGRVHTSRGAVFTDLIKRRAKELGIDLGLR